MPSLRFRVVDEKTGEVLYLTLEEMVARGFAALHSEQPKPREAAKKRPQG